MGMERDLWDHGDGVGFVGPLTWAPHASGAV